MKKLFCLVYLTYITVCVAFGSELTGTWKNKYETIVIRNDSILSLASSYIGSEIVLDRTTNPKRIYLLFEFPNEFLMLPFAVYTVSGDTLKLQKSFYEKTLVRNETYIKTPRFGRIFRKIFKQRLYLWLLKRSATYKVITMHFPKKIKNDDKWILIRQK